MCVSKKVKEYINLVSEEEKIVFKHLDVVRDLTLGPEGQLLEKNKRDVSCLETNPRRGLSTSQKWRYKESRQNSKIKLLILLQKINPAVLDLSLHIDCINV